MPRKSLIVSVLVLVAMAAACSEDPKVARQRYLAEGNRYMADKKYTEAVLSYRNAIRADATFGEARLKLAEAYLGAGDGRNALAESVRAADLLPDDSEAQLKAGLLLLLADQFQDARTRATTVLAKDPKNPRALILLGNALAGLKDLDAAVEQVEQAIDENPQLTLSYANLGVLQAARGDMDAAEAALRRAVDVAPNSESAHSALANFLWAAGRRDEAERELEAALKIAPRSAIVNRTIAAIRITHNRLPEAEPHLKAYAEVTGTIESRLLLADYYVGTGKASTAMPLLTAVAKEARGFAPAMARFAVLDFNSGRRSEAYGRLDEILARQRTNEVALELKSRFLLAEGKRQEALGVASSLVDSNVKSIRGHYVRGLALEETGARDQAIAAFQEVLRLAPSSVPAQQKLAALHLAQGNFKDALPLAQQIVKAQPLSRDAHLLYAQALLRSGDLTNAERELLVLVKETPASADVHAWLGMLYEAKRDTKSARRSFERALDISPESESGLVGLVSVDMAEKKTDAALARIEAELGKKPGDPRLIMMSAMAYVSVRDLPKAEAAYRKLLEIDPNNLDAYGRLGTIYLAQNRLDEARTRFEQMAERDPKSVVATTMIGTILVQQNRTPEARKHFERALQLNPRAAVAANNLAWDYANNGVNLDAALQLAQTAKAQLPDNASVTDTLGWIYYKKGLNAVAVSTLREAAKQNPSSPTIQYHLGLALLQNGDKAAARATLEGVLKTSPTFPDAAEARRVLSTIKG